MAAKSSSAPCAADCDSWKALEGARMAISKELLEILVCPKCKEEVTLTKDEDGLVCRVCKVIYPIKDDIPVMLIDEAIPLE
jgi:uncharacterized protein YbaR (Trm112 family)